MRKGWGAYVTHSVRLLLEEVERGWICILEHVYESHCVNSEAPEAKRGSFHSKITFRLHSFSAYYS